MTLPDITADWLLARAKDNGEGCLIWTRYSQNGNPKATFGSEAVPLNVRRVIWKALTGKEPRKGHIIKTCCGTWNCIDPAHLVQKPEGAKTKGRKQTLAAKVANSKAQRARSKIAGVIDEIKSSELTQADVAEKYGISQSLVSQINLNKIWRDYSNPFAGLGA